MTYEISQVIVVFAEACLVSSFYLKEKYKQLIFLLLSNVFRSFMLDKNIMFIFY